MLVVWNVKNVVLDAEFKNIILPDDLILYSFFLNLIKKNKINMAEPTPGEQ